MKWGSFGSVHILTLVLGAVILLGLYFLLKNASKKVQIGVLGVLSFSGITAVIFNLVSWGSPLEYLPLHLCSINALVLPIAVFTRNKQISNLLLLWGLGALAAVVVNTAQAEFEVFSSVFAFYFFPHVLEFGIPILLFKLGLVEKDPKCILSTLGITLGSYTVIHFLNLWINRYCEENALGITVNYMYSVSPDIPLLQLFYTLIPRSYWYMYCVVPVVAVYLAGVYAPEFLKAYQAKKGNKLLKDS